LRLNKSIQLLSFKSQANENNSTHERKRTMITVTYRVFEKDLNRTFENTKVVQSMADFRLFAYSLYSGNWEIVSVSE